LSYIDGLGAGAATGTGMTALTATAATCGIVGKQFPHAGVFTLAATITAPTFFYELGLSQDSATPGTGIDTAVHNFDGSIIIPPGCFVGLVGAPIAPGQDFVGSITWAELDLV
jgi:hypothetical protein